MSELAQNLSASPLRRWPDWPGRLAAFLGTRAHAPFSWGSSDCCLFACDAVLEMTGTDLAADFRGTYGCSRSALRVFHRAGGGLGRNGLRAIACGIAREEGIPEIAVRLARPGDIVLLEAPGIQDEVLAIVTLDGLSLAAQASAGVVHLPRRLGVTAWRI